jgi:hypothetical protein
MTLMPSTAPSIYQPESQYRNWMLKRGKREMVYYDEAQLKVLHEHFMSLDENNKGKQLFFLKLVFQVTLSLTNSTSSSFLWALHKALRKSTAL